MSEFVIDAWRHGIEVIDEVRKVVNGYLYVLQPWQLVVVSVCGTVVYMRVRRLIRKSDLPIMKRIGSSVYGLVMLLPSVREIVDRELKEASVKITKQIHRCDDKRVFVKELPRNGMSNNAIVGLADEYSSMGDGRSLISSGHVSGAVYNDRDDRDLQLLQTEIFKAFSYSNPLHPMLFADCRKMEAEVVRMVANMFNGNEEVCGTMTSGGTESILLAMLAYRNLANEKGTTEPQMVIPVTAHAAFDKAAKMFGVRLRHIPVDSDGRVDVKRMERAITSDTCVLVASAPNFPTGTIDDVESISKLGQKYNIPVHVDACLGGFLVAFMDDAGYSLPPFDFRLHGVTSISCDTHKYGYTPKGSSVILYRNVKFLRYQYICVPDWTGGVYATPTIAGSRSGLAVALTWATMLHFGRENYVARTREVIACARRIADAIKNEGKRGLKLLGLPAVSVVAFQSENLNVYAIGDRMSKRGWHLNALQNPPGMHICVTFNTVKANGDVTFIRDLKDVVDELMNEPDKGNSSEMAAIYGMAETVPDKSIISEVAFAYLDACYAMPTAVEEKESDEKLET
uniref:sphinganine-1-phosphate aldolase n=1 Tax=Parascaris univalens TaxID=6257 RepID=A0A915BA25_PARUN